LTNQNNHQLQQEFDNSTILEWKSCLYTKLFERFQKLHLKLFLSMKITLFI